MANNPYISSVGVLQSNSSDIFTSNVDKSYSKLLEDYLYTLENETIPVIRPIPAGVTPIKVYLQTRHIDVQGYYEAINAEQLVLSLEKDHRAETLYFEMDRYFEDVDLMSCACVIEYINAGGEPRLYPVSIRDLKVVMDEANGGYPVEKMYLAWNIGGAATAYPGTIKFAIKFYKIYYEIDPITKYPKNQKIIYSLNTAPATGYIAPGMAYKEYDDNNNGINDFYEDIDSYYGDVNGYETLIGMINQKDVYWIDV